MQCKLCLQDKALIQKSHIIPKQFYRDASEKISKGFGTIHSGDISPRIYLKKSKSKQAQNGVHVKNILCKDCEEKLGVFDNYAQTILLREGEEKQDKHGKYLEINNFDYKKFKLFCLSLLWRSQISDYVFFKEVQLSVIIQEELRTIIFNEDNIKDKFPILCLKYSDAYHFFVKRCDLSIYLFRLANYLLFIGTDENSCFHPIFQSYMVKPEEELIIRIRGEFTETPEYQSLVDNIDKYQA